MAEEETKPPGRPRGKEPGTVLTAWVPSSEYDRLVKLANEREKSLSRLVYELLRRKR